MNTIKLKTTLMAIVVTSGLFLFSMSAHAQTAQTKAAVESNLHVQNFKHGVLKVQFRYVNKELEQIQFTNDGNESIVLKVLHTNYILGKGDSIMMNPPSADHIAVEFQTHHAQKGSSTIDKVLGGRFTHRHLYELPKQLDHEITKSDEKAAGS